jgi:uncharacterized protein
VSIKKYFLDTSYAIALTSVKDKHHTIANVITSNLMKENCMIITTWAIIIEIANSFSKLNFRETGIDIIKSINSDSRIQILPISQILYNKGLDLFYKRRDKEWSLTDCFSFIVMSENNITDALTSDNHFVQAGFHKLL